MVHCHILQHMIMGMQTVWVMGDADEIRRVAEPYAAGYLEYGGSAYGNDTYDPLVYHHFDEGEDDDSHQFKWKGNAFREGQSIDDVNRQGGGRYGAGKGYSKAGGGY